jgi:hypothetical protein
MRDPVDVALMGAGERWRATQPAPRSIDPSIFTVDQPRLSSPFGTRTVSFAAGVAATLLVVLLAAALAPGWFPRDKPAEPGASPTARSLGTDVAHCPVTKPTTPFRPPKPGDLPPTKAWYGNVVLWTWLEKDGEVWDGLPRTEAGLGQKTFWWSAFFDVRSEPQPEIFVIGDRIGPPGHFGFGPGTNAGGDFGSAMLVGVDVPTEGCWNVTAHYRGASLNYVVWVGPRG